MEAIESEQDQVDLRTGESQHFSWMFVVVMILLGIFAPFVLTSSGYIGNYDYIVQSFVWSFHVGPYGSGWQLFPLYASFTLLLYIALRMVPPFVIYSYYKKKIPRKRALQGVILGDLLYIVGSIPLLVVAFLLEISYPIIPLPFQMSIGLLILWRYPISESTKIWEDSEGTKSWWEKKLGDSSKPIDAKNDENRLW